MKRFFYSLFFFLIFVLNAQNRGITNTSVSQYAKMTSVNIDAVRWTNGFLE